MLYALNRKECFALDRMPTLTCRVRAEAEQLGFFRMGVTPAGQIPWREHFDTWLARGMQGGMDYLERQAGKRRNPGLVLEGVRSILVLAMSYHTGTTLPEDPTRGRISRYAQGADYHRLVSRRLGALCDFITKEEPAARCRHYVDTGPVSEKVWGAHSTLGWMGKHTNLIARTGGSWFFLGAILLNLEMEYDKAEKDFCGTCSRCMDACPTGAIVAPYVVDARLCISYLTIELRGPIARHLRPLIGNRIFGCDDCQEVCPWNRFAVRSPEKELWPREGNLEPELASLAGMTEAEFLERFRDSPVRRARREGLVRNAVVALGNSRSPGAVPALRRALADASPVVRGHAAWALGRIAAPAAVSALERARTLERDPHVLEEIDAALSAGLSSEC
jgi:epoxyqueuosine reductase